MGSKLIVFLALAGSAAFGQNSAPAADRTFSFAHTSESQAIQEIATSIRVIADVSQISVDQAQKSLSVNGTPEQLALAEWLFTGLDQAPPTLANSSVREYRFSNGPDNIVRLFYLNRGQTIQEFQEFATMLRTVGDIRRVFTYNPSRVLALRGTADQTAMADWLIGEVEKNAGAPQPHSISAPYRFAASPGPGPNEDTIRVFYVGNASTIQNFQEQATLIRTISDIRRLYTYNQPRAVTVRGTSDQVALAAWLFDRVDKPPSGSALPPSEVYNYQAVDARENSVQVFYLPHTATPIDFQKIATQVRTNANIRRVFTYNAPRVLALRGALDQIEQAERLLKQLDPPDFP